VIGRAVIEPPRHEKETDAARAADCALRPRQQHHHLCIRVGAELHQRDRFGRDAQWIEYHPAYRELERAAFGEFGIHAMSVRKGVLGWPLTYPAVAKHAFTFLFNQAEFGLGCPINVTDGCAKLLSNFGSEALQAKYLDGLTQTDMSKLTQGGQFMTEKEGGSDVGKLTTTAVQDGDHWRLSGTGTCRSASRAHSSR
jgi:alkylation response protein AidB-like acyl-CoA dehydrogenase